MHPFFASAWAKYRKFCLSLLGSSYAIRLGSSRRAHECGSEFVGRKYVSRIGSNIIMLNGLNSAVPNHRGFLATERIATAEYTRVKADHAEKKSEVLRDIPMADLLGASRKKLSHFGEGGKPWLKVINHTGCPNATASKSQAEREAWVTNELVRAPFSA
jgi:hypothetical protein